MRTALFLTLVLLIASVRADDFNPAGYDPKFIHNLQENNTFKIMACQAAQSGDASPAIREWATRELASHAQTSRDLDAVAASKGLSLSPALDEMWKTRFDELKASDKSAFDRLFVTDLYLELLGEKATCTLEEKSSADEGLKGLAARTSSSAETEIGTLGKIKIGKT